MFFSIVTAFFVSFLLVYTAPGSFTVKAMSFNIRTKNAETVDPERWSARKNICVDVINRNSPDVIGIQEGEPEQLDYLASMSNGEWDRSHSILYRKDKFKIAEEGVFWYSDTPDVQSKSWKQDMIRSCRWVLFEKNSGGTFYFYNTHWTYTSNRAREKSAKLLVDRISKRSNKDVPYIVVGDMNAAENERSIRYLKNNGKAPMKDTFRDLKRDINNVGTYHQWSGDTDGSKIDYVLAGGKEFKTISATIDHFKKDGKYPSDHFPVIGEIQF